MSDWREWFYKQYPEGGVRAYHTWEGDGDEPCKYCGHRRMESVRGKWALCTDEGREAILALQAKLTTHKSGGAD